MSDKNKHIAVVDPGTHTPELSCFNFISSQAPNLSFSYHLPAMVGMASLTQLEPKISGIIMLGSSSSVYDNFDWQVSLERWLREQWEKKIPTLGICYGHQLLAHMFGGKVAFVNDEETKLQGFRSVDLQACPLWEKKAGPLFVSHREAVVQCPETMEIIGSSPAIAIEALQHRTLPIWSLQAHPETTTGFLNNQKHDPAEGTKENLQLGYEIVRGFLRYVESRH